jgi:pimeloyl-ACP methyl ester carboxylesterase
VRNEVLACVPFKWFRVRSAQSALQLASEVLDEAHRVSQPTLILQGDGDTVVDPAGAERLAARLGGHRTFHVIRDSDHLLALDAQHPEVFDHVTRFLNG